tara:strand:+ start:239 stop:556 length:318 start_codon:yes stop_codon:yes gene_type:complete
MLGLNWLLESGHIFDLELMANHAGETLVLIRGWLYKNKTSAVFISDTDREVTSYLRWNDLHNIGLLDEFLNSFVVLSKDHRDSFESYYIEGRERDLQEWFSNNLG